MDGASDVQQPARDAAAVLLRQAPPRYGQERPQSEPTPAGADPRTEAQQQQHEPAQSRNARVRCSARPAEQERGRPAQGAQTRGSGLRVGEALLTV